MSYFWIIIIVIVLFIFLNKKSTSRNQHIINDSNISIDSIVDGYEYFATLDPYTSLKALKHHGEVQKGPKSELPNYGNSRDGIWLEYFNEHSSPLSTKDKKLLDFLIKFRTIYESDSPISEKEKSINELIKKSGKSQQVLNAKKWYLWDLIEISGVSDSIAKILYSDGIRLKNDVQNASDETLLKVPGIGPGRLKQIRTFFKT